MISRTLRREYSKRKNPLPENLSFLEGLPFYAVTKCQLPGSKTIRTRIEILPRQLEKLSLAHKDIELSKEAHRKDLKMCKEAHVLDLKAAHEDTQKSLAANEELASELRRVSKDRDRLEKLRKELVSENMSFRENLGSDREYIPSGIKSVYGKFEEKGVNFGSPAILGGATGLKK